MQSWCDDDAIHTYKLSRSYQGVGNTPIASSIYIIARWSSFRLRVVKPNQNHTTNESQWMQIDRRTNRISKQIHEASTRRGKTCAREQETIGSRFTSDWLRKLRVFLIQ